jgi:hypothetical protein
MAAPTADHDHSPIAATSKVIEVEVGEVRVERPEHGSRRWLQAVHARPNVAIAGEAWGM